ncbi:MAG: AmmeMemoRadiSam system protein A [Nitrospinaceae bacterium]|nr:AmmeMemoRadiSam system protein A [Nitrospinaceae bacterium]NIR53811.1 AmmeMemoRadiSam system protein A [Nitrospinaceae bacterium]NIS84222.1 AmmeMemoRadiSam system protein A [Nitrospinaceae bacterium]NIT81028.1 AmmeMemoRadiSam system protein A [Nitrospinaceae bacterium]NIU43317.1 AmmeMemoRadiSam system protein A [Nitrospinaceae bacterium]
MITGPHPYVVLATESVRHYLQTGMPLPCPENLTEDLTRQAAVFVSIKKGNQLRGCIGNLTPTRSNLANEIIHTAISAAVRDPRFAPVTEGELDTLSFSIDLLSPLTKVNEPSKMDCKKYGLVVKSGDKQGVLLPGLEGVDTVEKQIKICTKKAGLDEKERYDLYRFEVERYF